MIISNCAFTDNKGDMTSVLLNRGNVTLLNCLLTKNASTKTINNFINSNFDEDKSSVIIINTTIVDNIGEGVYSEQELLIQNSIIWNN